MCVRIVIVSFWNIAPPEALFFTHAHAHFHMQYSDARFVSGICFVEGGISWIFTVIAYSREETLSTDSSFLGVTGLVFVVAGLMFWGYARKCMHAKLDATTEQENTLKPSAEKPAEAADTSKTGPQNCPHYLGYLKERAKNTPIPDECLTCPEVTKCMLG